VILPSFHIHADVYLLFGSILAFYFVALRRHEAATGEVTDAHHKRLFALGVGILWLGSSWPIHDLAERYLYSVHMTQHMLFTLVAAPILIAGVPVWMYREALRPRSVRTLFRFFTRPLVALIVFNGMLLFTHWPAVVEASVKSEPLHFLLHVALVLSALAMWWPVMSPLPEMPSLSAPGQMLYLFLQSLAPTIPASFLTFGQSPLYPIYATFPRIWGVSVMTDQLMAGLIMKLVGSAILWVVIAAIFFRWFAAERRTDLDATRYADVEREIRAELRR
jgi:putative membrane protein